MFGRQIKSRTEIAGEHAIRLSQDLKDFATQLRTFGFDDEAKGIEKCMIEINKIGHSVLDHVAKFGR